MGCCVSTGRVANADAVDVMCDSPVTVNGIHVKTAQGNIAICRSVQLKLVAVVDGKETKQEFVCPQGAVFNVYVEGSARNVETVSGHVTVSGNVSGNVETVSGNVSCKGNIHGDVDTVSGSVGVTQGVRGNNGTVRTSSTK
jgi:cytoskeletal protein CcmA (bactofilin family)